MTRLADTYWPELAGSPRGALLVPVGSLEQHGPHLPLDTDARIARAVAERVEAGCSRTDLAPVVPVGASGEHRGFPGTLSIGTRVLADLVIELVRDAAADWEALVVINGHGGNTRALRRAAATAHHEQRRLTVVDLHLPGMDGHAGRAETSIMLHLAPERVWLDRAEPGVRTPVDVLLPRLVRDGVRGVSRNGVLGDPTGASADEGRQLVEQLTAKVLTEAGLTPRTARTD